MVDPITFMTSNDVVPASVALDFEADLSPASLASPSSKAKRRLLALKNRTTIFRYINA